MIKAMVKAMVKANTDDDIYMSYHTYCATHCTHSSTFPPSLSIFQFQYAFTRSQQTRLARRGDEQVCRTMLLIIKNDGCSIS